MPKRYDISKPGDMRRWARDVQKELQKNLEREQKQHPLRVPVDYKISRAPSLWRDPLRPAESHQTYNTTVNVPGHGNQVAIGNHGDVHQSIERDAELGLGDLVQQLRSAIPQLDLGAEDAADFGDALDRIEQEIQREERDEGRIRRNLRTLEELVKDNGAEIAKTLTPIVTAVLQGFGG